MTTEPKVNGLIFKELIKRGYSLDGNTRIWNIADSKLWYLKAEQAQAYLDLEASQDYSAQFKGSDLYLINKHFDKILQKIKSKKINVIDLGCGDGVKGAYIVERFMNEGKKVRYCPIDISSYMVQKAIKNISKIKVDEIIESKFNISDFENLSNITPLLNQGEYSKNVFLLLGNTLGNFEIHDILYQIRSAMKGEDTLLIVNGIKNEKWKGVVKEASNDKNLDNFFGQILTQLGFKKSEFKLNVKYENSRIELYYIISIDKKVKFQDRLIQFNKGDQILVAVGYKHDESDLKTVLNMYFDEVELKSAEDKKSALIICKK